MRMRLCSALLGVVITVLGAAGSAQARPEKVEVYETRPNGSVTRVYSSKNYKATTPARYSSTKSSKRYSSAGTGKTYRRAAYAKKRAPGRSYASGDGGSSRGCLTSSARTLLNRIESNFGPVSIVSTCRPGAVIAGSGKPSKHRHGEAIDFDAGGRKGAIVNWLIANHHSGGTMTYRDMSHVHVDVGYHFVKLGANSHRG